MPGTSPVLPHPRYHLPHPNLFPALGEPAAHTVRFYERPPNEAREDAPSPNSALAKSQLLRGSF